MTYTQPLVGGTPWNEWPIVWIVRLLCQLFLVSTWSSMADIRAKLYTTIIHGREVDRQRAQGGGDLQGQRPLPSWSSKRRAAVHAKNREALQKETLDDEAEAGNRQSHNQSIINNHTPNNNAASRSLLSLSHAPHHSTRSPARVSRLRPLAGTGLRSPLPSKSRPHKRRLNTLPTHAKPHRTQRKKKSPTLLANHPHRLASRPLRCPS